MPRKVLWKSPALPAELLDDEQLHWDVQSRVLSLTLTDHPSASDMRALFVRYNESTAPERDAIDAAFVWMCGYSFASIVAMVVAQRGEAYEDVLKRWKRLPQRKPRR
jgi:hypothetical protein